MPPFPEGQARRPSVSEAHQRTVHREVLRLDGLQLVHHLTDDDHTCPDGADTVGNADKNMSRGTTSKNLDVFRQLD